MKVLLLILLFIILFMWSFSCKSQTQFRIDSIGKIKGHTAELFCTSMKGEKACLGYSWMGAGKPDLKIGMWLTYHPEGIGKRKTKITFNN